MSTFDPLYLLYGVLAFVPAFIWLIYIFNKQSNKTFQIIIFLSGVFSVLPIFLIQELFNLFPQFDFISVAENLLADQFLLQFLIMYAWVSVSEELVKQRMIRFLDKKYLLIQTINDSINFSLISALGFSFAENIFYFYNIGTHFGMSSLLVAYFFRSVFTTCGHLVFSGFFGYYYGIAKFSISMVEKAELQGNKLFMSRLFGKIFKISKIQAFQEITILKGLLIAIFLHTTYNFSLEMSSYLSQPLLIAFSAIFISSAFLYLRRILKYKSGSLVLVRDSSDNQSSSMAKSDEDIVIELLGMWFEQKKYVDVLHICERLLVRDPDNRIVQLFKAKAMDQMDGKNPYKVILNKIFPSQN